MNSLYIHIPFCEQKCFYCSFVVSVGQEKRVDQYLDCLEKEWQAYPQQKIRTLYLGGGTPTFLSAQQLERLFRALGKYFDLSACQEVTIEANPEGIDPAKARALKGLGVNRVSLGVQSLNDESLKYLGRIHNAQKAIETFEVFRKTGFDNISVDLMFSFPNQAPKQIKEDIQKIAALGSEHISLYALNIEENSRFHAKKVKLASGEDLAEQYNLVLAEIAKRGFEQYEISNFAKKKRESRHNINYWVGGDYIGLGVGAHGHAQGRRSWNVSKLTEYIKAVEGKGDALEAEENLTKEQRLMEKVLFGLRMNRGVAICDCEREFAATLGPKRWQLIKDLMDEGLLVENQGIVCATERGRCVLDEISSQLV